MHEVIVNKSGQIVYYLHIYKIEISQLDTGGEKYERINS